MEYGVTQWWDGANAIFYGEIVLAPLKGTGRCFDRRINAPPHRRPPHQTAECVNKPIMHHAHLTSRSLWKAEWAGVKPRPCLVIHSIPASRRPDDAFMQSGRGGRMESKSTTSIRLRYRSQLYYGLLHNRSCNIDHVVNSRSHRPTAYCCWTTSTKPVIIVSSPPCQNVPMPQPSTIEQITTNEQISAKLTNAPFTSSSTYCLCMSGEAEGTSFRFIGAMGRVIEITRLHSCLLVCASSAQVGAIVGAPRSMCTNTFV